MGVGIDVARNDETAGDVDDSSVFGDFGIDRATDLHDAARPHHDDRIIDGFRIGLHRDDGGAGQCQYAFGLVAGQVDFDRVIGHR